MVWNDPGVIFKLVHWIGNFDSCCGREGRKIRKSKLGTLFWLSHQTSPGQLWLLIICSHITVNHRVLLSICFWKPGGWVTGFPQSTDVQAFHKFLFSSAFWLWNSASSTWMLGNCFDIYSTRKSASASTFVQLTADSGPIYSCLTVKARILHTAYRQREQKTTALEDLPKSAIHLGQWPTSNGF